MTFITTRESLSPPGLWVCEAVCYYQADGESDDHQQPLDLSIITELFRKCDPEDPEYDAAFHRQLFEEKPHFFGKGGLPLPS